MIVFAKNFAKVIVKMKDKKPVIKIVNKISNRLEVERVGRSFDMVTAAPVLVFCME